MKKLGVRTTSMGGSYPLLWYSVML